VSSSAAGPGWRSNTLLARHAAGLQIPAILLTSKGALFISLQSVVVAELDFEALTFSVTVFPFKSA
jgi:hypothetical protein